MFGANGSGSALGKRSWRNDGDGRNHSRLDLNRRVDGVTGGEDAAPTTAASTSSGSSLESAGYLAQRYLGPTFLEALDSRFKNRRTIDARTPGDNTGSSHGPVVGPSSELPGHSGLQMEFSSFGPPAHSSIGEQELGTWEAWISTPVPLIQRMPWAPMNAVRPSPPALAPPTYQERSLLEALYQLGNASPRPEEYFTYPKQQIHFVLLSIVFYIQGRLENGVIYPEEPGLFDVAVFHPSGRHCPVTIQLDTVTRTRFICSFDSTESGLYRGYAKLKYPSPQHINGSPFEFSVSRQYGGCKGQVIPTTLPPVKYRGLGSSTQRIVKCWGIDVDRFAEKIYMADKETDQIRVISPQGVKLGEFGEKVGIRKMFRPTGVAVDMQNKRLVITDKDNHRICFWTLDGQFISAFGSHGHRDGEFYYPWGLAVSPNGELIVVADSRNHRLQMFDRHGNFLRKYSIFELNPFDYKHQFEYPRGVCFDNSGDRIFVSDFNRHAVYVMNLDLTVKTDFVEAKRLMRPQGMAVDVAGNLLVCASRNDRIHVVTSNGILHSSIHGNDQFSPQDLCILRDGLLVVLDAEGSIRVY